MRFKQIANGIMLLSFIEPEYFTSIGLIHMLFTAVRLFSVGYIVYEHINNVKFTLFDLLLLVYIALTSMSTMLNGGSLFTYINRVFPSVCFAMLAETLILKDARSAINCIAVVLSSLAVVNLVFYIVFPNGYSNYYSSSGLNVIRYFLGVDNQFASVIIPAAIVAVIFGLMNGKKTYWFSAVTVITVVLTLLLTRSGSGLIGMGMLIAYALIMLPIKSNKRISPYLYVGIYVAVFVGLIVFRAQGRVDYLIEDVMGKDITLSSRTLIWDQAQEMISESPIIGYGDVDDGKYIMLLGHLPRSAHNIILQTMLLGGSVGLVSLLSVFAVSLFRLNKCKDSKISESIAIGLLIMMVLMLVEVYSLNTTFMLLVLAYHSKLIISAAQDTSQTSQEVVLTEGARA